MVVSPLVDETNGTFHHNEGVTHGYTFVCYVHVNKQYVRQNLDLLQSLP